MNGLNEYVIHDEIKEVCPSNSVVIQYGLLMTFSCQTIKSHIRMKFSVSFKSHVIYRYVCCANATDDYFHKLLLTLHWLRNVASCVNECS